MSNPKINLRLLRQYLASQFERVTFRNGDVDTFKDPFLELTGSQKHSYIALGNDLAEAELKLRLPKFRDAEVIHVPIEIARVHMSQSHVTAMEGTCLECDSKPTIAVLWKNGTFYCCCDDHISKE